MHATPLRYRQHARRYPESARSDRRRRAPAIPARDRLGLLLLAAALIFIAGVQLGIHHGAALYGCR